MPLSACCGWAERGLLVAACLVASAIVVTLTVLESNPAVVHAEQPELAGGESVYSEAA